ncbi:mandelate racemase/muconate lactonizing enzyme family protein [Tunicatimonas pelagia]|uniref:mandelate racemase/muconate lactonizing enzyme family protein n=1 Tax=Tunicatimonas pelagia TaxID=931531 RepID=UPI002666F57C|nr:mandelate racemase/muconate lactonizing enzyme family protein [Tunicatimonas pelagia]WKN44212.1 mandelate racemase/muconate lactonizing enzyme family protein [Tunicatimonas pelagia]
MSKIVDVRPVLLSAPYADPETNLEVQLHLPSQYRTCGLVEITLEDGTKGLGEGYLAVFAPRVFEQIIRLIRPYLIGKEVMEVNKIYHNLRIVIGYWSMQGAAKHALSAVEIAMQDCRAQLLQLPVYQVLGGKLNDTLTLYGSGGDSISPEAMAEELDYLQAHGIKFFKIRARNNELDKAIWCVDEGAERGIQIAVDMTQNLMYPGQSVSEVVRFVEKIQDFTGRTLFFVEEVLGPANTQEYPLLRQKLNTPVAGGEIVTTAAELNDRITQGCYDIAQPDATVIGGISAVMEVFATARQKATEVIVHCWGGPVGMMANYHAALAGGGSFAEWPMPAFPLREAMVQQPWKIESGNIHFPDTPGLGVILTEEIEQKYAFREDAVYQCLPTAIPRNKWPE